jgi:glutathionyl-hydroquinone reductase
MSTISNAEIPFGLDEILALAARSVWNAGRRRNREPGAYQRHHYQSQRTINPIGIVPLGLEIKLTYSRKT